MMGEGRGRAIFIQDRGANGSELGTSELPSGKLPFLPCQVLQQDVPPLSCLLLPQPQLGHVGPVSPADFCFRPQGMEAQVVSTTFHPLTF
jgi:hypothetical protein